MHRVTLGVIFFMAVAPIAPATTSEPLSPRANRHSAPDSVPEAGLDSGMDASGLATTLPALEQIADNAGKSSSRWMRLRGINPDKEVETRTALQSLRASGVRTCVLLRRSTTNWKVSYLPVDLREAYDHGRKLGAAFGDLVDAWEVDNEPDLGFVPESAERYTAFLKAMYLGLKAGSMEHGARGRTALVVMGPLGLPPGPWLERFAANDGFTYTDGYNYHYYGYAEDFSGVFQQHESAAAELSKLNARPAASAIRSFPVFMTEIGYGMLGKNARNTKEGRLRQWRWFKSVGEQLATLKPMAPMAFYLPPYLEHDTSEYGLTVPPGGAVKISDEGSPGLVNSGESWTAGGITFSPADFGAGKGAPWMALIGADIGGNQATPALAQWLETITPSGLQSQVSGLPKGGTRSWPVTTAAPSPVVIDFLPGEGLSHIKRYHGSFVTGKEPPIHKIAESGKLKAEDSKPKIPEPKPVTPIPRSEDFILQVRTRNGNLYEVYPTRQATTDWQRFLEPGDNFTMAFYGRAALPWRFKDNQPVSLVIVMYPKQLPAVYEFRRAQLIKLAAGSSQPSANLRYSQGTIVLYNFSEQPVTGKLILPEPVVRVVPNATGIDESIVVLQPGERREIPVVTKLPWERYERFPTEFIFMPTAGTPQSSGNPVARFRTELIPDIGGMKAIFVASFLTEKTRRGVPAAQKNHLYVAQRPRVAEEAPMTEQLLSTDNPEPVTDISVFSQPGAAIAATPGGLSITITNLPAGKPQRIEVEIPWPDGWPFQNDQFLSLDFRLRSP